MARRFVNFVCGLPMSPEPRHMLPAIAPADIALC